ncbi:MAG: lactate utilization protein [Deltaproteobacteria bacterium]|nr:lactate utilization protein [Deltaproteobacteria bacterium]
MDDPVDERYWLKRLAPVKENLEGNGFEAHVAEDLPGAREIVLEEILPRIRPRLVSWGDSLTVIASGLLDDIRALPGVEFLDPFEDGLSSGERFDRRRRALLADLFVTGTNALTRDGRLVNLDMVGNRVGGITFGPRRVLILAGRNKIVSDMERAMEHIRSHTAPANAIRHHAGGHTELNPPCVTTGTCSDCASPMRICNTWTITEKSFPPGRIIVVLINRDLGL